MSAPSLPPAFQLVGLDRETAAFERAVRAAPRGVEDGTVYRSERDDLLDMALVLEPEAPAADVLDAVYVLAIAGCEALARTVPPGISVTCAWPGELLLAGARAGGVRAAVAPTAGQTMPPPWLVLGLCLQLAPLGDLPDRLPDRTSLAEQGAGDVAAAALLEALSRAFLHWAGRWREEGPAAVYAGWNRLCYRRGEPGMLTLHNEPFAGPIEGLDAKGRFVIGRHRLPLTDALELLA
ncbi:MAG: biotin/lipoate--protein ligase family protein [Geminicoccaceae bacterium]